MIGYESRYSREYWEYLMTLKIEKEDAEGIIAMIDEEELGYEVEDPYEIKEADISILQLIIRAYRIGFDKGHGHIISDESQADETNKPETKK